MYAEYQQYKQNSLEPTGVDIEGPFYKLGAPEIYDLSGGHPNLTVSGNVLGTDGNPIANAVLDIWQADEKGVYDMNGFRFRGKCISTINTGCDENIVEGSYFFSTVIPGDYEIGPGEFRCAHIHVKVTANGFKPLTTQLYFADDQYNKTDHWFDPKRIIQLPETGVGNGRFDFVLERGMILERTLGCSNGKEERL